MAPRFIDEEVAHEFRFFRVYKNGRIQMFMNSKKVPPYDDPFTGVKTKDVIMSLQPKISARIFLPKTANKTRMLPVIFYMPGNGYCVRLAFAPRYHIFLTAVVDQANAIAVCISYGDFPGRPGSACYDDSWAALRWVVAHATGNGPDPWLNDYADFGRFFICGNSSGGNIAHYLASRVGSVCGFPGVTLVGLGVLHPYFGGKSRMDDEMWMYIVQDNKGSEDPRMKPATEDLGRIRCERVLVAVGGDEDALRDCGVEYYERLKHVKRGGTVEMEDSKYGRHCFFLYEPNHENTLDFIKKLASFINKEVGVATTGIKIITSKM